MDAIALMVNGVEHTVAAPPDAPLLYVLRNDLKLKGTKFGCGLGLCGACTVLIDGRAALSCDTPLWAVAGKAVTTIEGLPRGGAPHPLQAAFLTEEAAQCGYCTSGMIVAAAALLAEIPQPSRAEICAGMARNLCRCGAHPRIIRAIERAARDAEPEGAPGAASCHEP
ncbi:(2Fe-2S)-binding protein [Aquabacter spiritensis]|uniref:Nicotinate dehydrogenase subunit A n=1 Tax=Aquabacter spiritensis TaxID=933073 RepID=A0A4R3LSP3_9HYPH|nr:(2Fe-2S)-binding protein [Aquabacter spiritensis]TCT03583.1 nicotinate dehydrogenase subunit A [Aquabacter spiritensis]